MKGLYATVNMGGRGQWACQGILTGVFEHIWDSDRDVFDYTGDSNSNALRQYFMTQF